MTLVVALGCSDGVIIAADSASSDAETGTKQPVHKIKQLGDLPILYGGSGDVGLMQNIEDALSGFSMRPTLKRTRQELKKLVVPQLMEAKNLHVAYPQTGFNLPPAAILLFAGITDGRPWILEIERDGRDTVYADEYGNFAAIGSGKPWAQAVIRPHLMTERDLRLGKVFAHRVLEDAINLVAGFVSKPVYIHAIKIDGTMSEVDDAEMKQLEDACELWRELEREAVGKLLASDAREATIAQTLPALTQAAGNELVPIPPSETDSPPTPS